MSRVPFWWSYILSVLLASNTVYASLLCLSCAEVIKPKYCEYVTTCGDHQVCFVDLYITESGSRRYNVGCRDSRICSSYNASDRHLAHSRASVSGQLIRQVTHRRAGVSSHLIKNVAHRLARVPDHHVAQRPARAPGHLICATCCDSNICNQAGCGEQGYPSDLGPLCYSCHQQMSPDDCYKVKLCSSNQVCSMTSRVIAGDIVYATSCEDKMLCEKRLSGFIIDAIGRREADQVFLSCNTCCNDTLCNTNCDLLTTTTVAPTLSMCINYIPECGHFSPNFCADPLYGYWAQLQCPKLCGKCHKSSTTPTTTVTTTSSLCVNNRPDCAAIDTGTMCTEFPVWSQANCYKYCKYSPCK